MTEIETRRVNEAVDLQISLIRQCASRLSTRNADELELNLNELGQGIAGLRAIIEGLPHRHETPSS